MKIKNPAVFILLLFVCSWLGAAAGNNLQEENKKTVTKQRLIRKDLLEKGFALAKEKNLTVTDDVSFAELLKRPVKLVMSRYRNIKITTPEDLSFARYILNEQPIHAEI